MSQSKKLRVVIVLLAYAFAGCLYEKRPRRVSIFASFAYLAMTIWCDSDVA